MLVFSILWRVGTRVMWYTQNWTGLMSMYGGAVGCWAFIYIYEWVAALTGGNGWAVVIIFYIICIAGGIFGFLVGKAMW